MKGLALETVVKWIILIVVTGVVINLLFFFSDEIKRIITGYTEEEEPEVEIIESSEFSASQIKTYMKACWDKTGGSFQEDVVCYILRGSVIDIDPISLESIDIPATIDLTNFNSSKSVTVIRFEDVGNKIIVES